MSRFPDPQEQVGRFKQENRSFYQSYESQNSEERNNLIFDQKTEFTQSFQKDLLPASREEQRGLMTLKSGPAFRPRGANY